MDVTLSGVDGLVGIIVCCSSLALWTVWKVVRARDSVVVVGLKVVGLFVANLCGFAVVVVVVGDTLVVENLTGFLVGRGLSGECGMSLLSIGERCVVTKGSSSMVLSIGGISGWSVNLQQLPKKKRSTHVPMCVPFAFIQSMANMHTPSSRVFCSMHGKGLMFWPLPAHGK